MKGLSQIYERTFIYPNQVSYHPLAKNKALLLTLFQGDRYSHILEWFNGSIHARRENHSSALKSQLHVISHLETIEPSLSEILLSFLA